MEFFLDELYKKYSKLVYNYLNSLCENSSIAEELTQETFYRAIKGINKFNNECKISTWLCQIAKNLWFDYLRKEKDKNIVSIDDDNFVEKLILENSFDEDFENRSDVIDLYKYIHKLDEDTKEVFYLRLKGELSFKDIGEILDKSENWARLAFYRGKIKLKEAIDNDKK